MTIVIDPYQNLDLLAIARWQYGPTAYLGPYPDHAYKWQAFLPGKTTPLSLDLQGYYDRAKRPDGSLLFGPYYRVVLIGMGGDGWKVFNTRKWFGHVLPVVHIASDFVWKPVDVKTGVDNFLFNVLATSDWYATQIGKGLRVLKPCIIPGTMSSVDWYNMYVSQVDRYDTLKKCEESIYSFFNNYMNSGILYAATQFTGLASKTWDWDAAAVALKANSGLLTVVSSFATCHRYDPNDTESLDNTAVYALTHEFGHNFRLGHTDPVKAGTTEIGDAVMQTARPPKAKLFPYEKEIVSSSMFFT